jgi:hypothetical protein
MAYHMLFERDAESGRWSPEAGDRDKAAITFERQDRRDHGAKAANLRIVRFPRVPSQNAVMAMALRFNAPVAS